jgi:hypothetical protein
MTVCGHFMQHRWVYIYRTRHKAWLSSQCPDDSASDSAIYPPLIPLQIVFVVSEPLLLLRSHRVRRIHSAQVTFGLQWVGIIPFQLARPRAAQGKEREKLIDLSRSSPLCTVDAGATPLSTLGPVASPEPQPQSLSRRQSALLVPRSTCVPVPRY